MLELLEKTYLQNTDEATLSIGKEKGCLSPYLRSLQNTLLIYHRQLLCVRQNGSE